MKTTCISFAVLFVIGLVAAEPESARDDTLREKRGFSAIHHGLLVPGLASSRSYAFGDFSSEQDDFRSGGVSKSAAAAAAAASKAASAKRAKAAQLSKAAHAAQAVAFGESSLASKTATAVKASDKMYNTAISLSQKLGEALREAEALTTQAWKSLAAAKVVESAQENMAREAQSAADKLSQRQLHSLSELQAAQAAAIKAQELANKALSRSKPKSSYFTQH